MVRARWPDRKLARTTRDGTRGPQTAPARRRVRSLRHVQGLVPSLAARPPAQPRRRRARGRCRRARLASDRWHRLARAGRELRAEPVAPRRCPLRIELALDLVGRRAPRAPSGTRPGRRPRPLPGSLAPSSPRFEGRTEPPPELSFRARVASHASSEVCARARSRIGRPARDPPGRPGRQALVGASRALRTGRRGTPRLGNLPRRGVAVSGVRLLGPPSWTNE